MSLYVAYGSNLNVQQMSYRCPGATVAFTGYLINWKLLYRGSRTGSYATVKRQKGSRVPVAVWNIDSKNEKALDLYEGYPRFYKKRNVFVQLKNGTRKKAMIYLLPDSATAGRPSILRTEIYSVHYRSFKLANMPVSSMKYFHLLISFTVAFIAVIMFFNSVSKSEKFSSLIPQNSTPSSPIFSPIKRIFPTMGHPCLSNS